MTEYDYDYEYDSYYTEYDFLDFYFATLFAYALLAVLIIFMVKTLFRPSDVHLDWAFVLFAFWPLSPLFLVFAILVVQHELYVPLFEAHYVIAAIVACTVLVFALWPVRRCQTCGRRVKTYCHECEDRLGDTEHDGWTDPKA